MTTGRTVCKYCKFTIEDNGGTMRDIGVSTWGNVGLTYEEKDLSVCQEAIRSVLLGQGTFATTIGGPFDNSAAVAASTDGVAPALSGAHTVLYPLAGANTPRSFGIYFGIQGYWTTGDPVFGAIDSILVKEYQVSPDGTSYTASIVVAANRTNDPAWGTALIAASS